MQWRDLSLSKKLIIPMAVIGGLMLILSVMQVFTLNALSNNYSHINEHYLPAIDKVLNADRDFYQAQIAERTIAMGGMTDDFVKMHKENLDQVLSRVKSILDYDVASDIHEKTETFLTAFSQWRPKSQQLVDAVAANSMDITSATTMSTGALDKEFESLRDILDGIGEQLGAQAALLQKNNHKERISAFTNIGIMMAIAIAIVVLISIFLPKLFSTPINQLSHELDDLAKGKGDLTARMPRLGQDEIGKLSHNFNRFISGLHKIIVQIQEAGNAVGQARGSLQKDSEDSLRVSEQYSKAMDVVAHSNHEMEDSIHDVAENTQQVSVQAKESIDVVKKVSKQFGRARVEIESLAENIDSASSVIGELAEETTNIASVLDVIKGIAEQTNLLALNAAIEAARAGEQGRGFAVVADEVRTLASKTQQSTEDINVMIDKLRGGADRAVDSMKGAQEIAGRTVEYSQDSESQVLGITSSLEEITDRITQVASAVEQQTRTIGEINGNLVQTKELSQQGMSSAHSIGSAVSTLNTQAEKLRALIMNFQV